MIWILILLINRTCQNDAMCAEQSTSASTIGTYQTEADCLADRRSLFSKYWSMRDARDPRLLCVEYIPFFDNGDAR